MPRTLVYLWTGPTTLVGLLFVVPTLLTGGSLQRVDGVLEVYGGFARRFLRYATPLPGGARAMTLGHVVLGVDRVALAQTREHERVHVRQCERWGPLFIPAYLSASLFVKLRGGDLYRDNPFEREAFEQDAAPSDKA